MADFIVTVLTKNKTTITVLGLQRGRKLNLFIWTKYSSYVLLEQIDELVEANRKKNNGKADADTWLKSQRTLAKN